MLNDSQNSRRGRPSSPKPARRGNPSTMNRPDSESLNSNATSTVAAQFFARNLEEDKDKANKPSIANGFIPPVIEKQEEKTVSPFKAPPKGPIKRPKNAANIAFQQEEKEPEEEVKKAPEGPQIAKFMNIPIVQKPESPFKPISEAPQNNTGLKAPIKRPPSASVNHAAAKKEEAEREKIKEELDAMGGAFKPLAADTPAPEKEAAPEKPAFAQSAFVARPDAGRSPFSRPKGAEKPAFTPVASTKPRTMEKTFVPLAPVPFTEKQKEDPVSPFAPPVQKTEEQKRIEEENAKRALEQSRIEVKKSRLDKLRDGLNRPLF